MAAWRSQEDARLYEQHGKPLEKEHKGEIVAIGPDGETILARRSGEVLRQAVNAFGSGNFALRRVGYDYVERWVTLFNPKTRSSS